MLVKTNNNIDVSYVYLNAVHPDLYDDTHDLFRNNVLPYRFFGAVLTDITISTHGENFYDKWVEYLHNTFRN